MENNFDIQKNCSEVSLVDECQAEEEGEGVKK